ncbi:UDP-N-acetylglucosamine 1-carboxyvinyltransferase [Enterocloster sp.]|uniref:UDP-N-acetylglucosamine 1-carboxyvinyltransferase n=1 Tax=Enterocloster sp. TaxID=2719315 RepID=UPI003078030B
MSAIRVSGCIPLKGEISIQGSKNAALPMMAAALLHKGLTVLTNVPRIQDTACMMKILEALGCSCIRRGCSVFIDAGEIKKTQVPQEYVRSMRSSIILLGALLGRMGQGNCCYPGGCLIGARPIDLHLMALNKMGAVIREEDGIIEACAGKDGRLKGTEIVFSYPSVGATEQALLAAVLAEGVTIIRGAAMEPEISQLCGFLNNMGAVICGAGTKNLMIQGVRSLRDSAFRVEGDRIVAGTYGAAVMAAGGDVILKGVRPSALKLPLALFSRSGGKVTVSESSGRIQATGIGCEKEGRIRISSKGPAGPLALKTGPYPEFPTDLQSPFMAFLAAGRGVSRIEERVFEGRFGIAGELEKMGALIRLEGKTAVIYGAGSLKGSAVKAADLRGGAALAVAALAAKGETVIEDCRHIERGYEDICRDLSALGARIQWIGE